MVNKGSLFFGRDIEKSKSFLGKPLGRTASSDEFLHNENSSEYNASETFYYGFNIPEHAIDCIVYLWFHPTLRTLSAGVFIWQGFNTTTANATYVNYINHLEWPEFNEEGLSIEEIGLTVRIDDPLEKFQIHYSDGVENVDFSVTCRAIMPPAVRPDGSHFTQAVRTSGTLNLRGQQFDIDGFFSRDHSWGHARKESRIKGPPLSWSVGVFSENLAFHSLAFDDPGCKPTWVDAYPEVAEIQNLVWGYLHLDGNTRPLVKAEQLTYREQDGITVKAVDLNLEDVSGRRLELRGEIIARMPWYVWQNNYVVFGLTRWQEASGEVGWGDVMDNLFSDFPRRFVK